MLLHDGSGVAPLSVPVPDDASALAAFRGRAARSGGGLGVEVVHARPPEVWSPAVGDCAGAVPRGLRPRAGHRLAADLLQRTHARRPTSNGSAASRRSRRRTTRPTSRRCRPPRRPPTPRCATSCRRGMRSPAARRSARWCTRCSSSSSDLSDDAAVTALVRRAGRAMGAGRRRGRAEPPGCSLRWPHRWASWPAVPRSPAYLVPIGCRSWTSSCRWPVATRRARRRCCSPISFPCGVNTCRPACCRRTPMRWPSCPTYRCAATSPAASTPCCGSASPADPRYLVVDYKTNRLGAFDDEPLTAWHYRSAAMDDRDDRGALPAAGAALRGRAAPLPALAPARLRPAGAPRRRALPVPARHGRGRAWSTRRVRRRVSSHGGRRPVSWSACRSCWRGRHDHDYDAALALRAGGLLASFNRAGILTAADVHVARRLGAIGGETDEAVLLAVALVVRVDPARLGGARPGDGRGDDEPRRGRRLPRRRAGRRGARLAGRLGVAVRVEPAWSVGRYGWRDHGCGSRGTGTRRSRSPPSCCARSASQPSDLDEDVLTRGLARLFPRRGRRRPARGGVDVRGCRG